MKHCWNFPIDSGVRFLGDKPLEFLGDFVRTFVYIYKWKWRGYTLHVYIFIYIHIEFVSFFSWVFFWYINEYISHWFKVRQLGSIGIRNQWNWWFYWGSRVLDKNDDLLLFHPFKTADLVGFNQCTFHGSGRRGNITDLWVWNSVGTWDVACSLCTWSRKMWHGVLYSMNAWWGNV